MNPRNLDELRSHAAILAQSGHRDWRLVTELFSLADALQKELDDIREEERKQREYVREKLEYFGPSV